MDMRVVGSARQSAVSDLKGKAVAHHKETARTDATAGHASLSTVQPGGHKYRADLAANFSAGIIGRVNVDVGLAIEDHRLLLRGERDGAGESAAGTERSNAIGCKEDYWGGIIG